MKLKITACLLNLHILRGELVCICLDEKDVYKWGGKGGEVGEKKDRKAQRGCFNAGGGVYLHFFICIAGFPSKYFNTNYENY